jgi:hypothetical protein
MVPVSIKRCLMRCPHCLKEFHDSVKKIQLGEDTTSDWAVHTRTCPACGKYVISLREEYLKVRTPGGERYQAHREFQCYPKTISRTPIGPEVTAAFAADYREACVTLADSPKASAALSRRCLQHILREKAGVKHGNLADEIQQVIDSDKIPSHLAESLDAVRNIGNFAAHPMKTKATGEIIDVEPGEAEWNLDVIESLFHFYFTQPALLKKKKDALNAKLKAAGKPEMK